MQAIHFFLHYRYVILFAWVLTEQLGVPVPAVPLLISVGTLIATHQMSGPLSLLCAVFAALLGDVTWFMLGRRYGNNVLRLLCRLSLEADTCVAKTEGYFEKRGVATLVVAKFIPGLSTVAPPIAGEMAMTLRRFLAYDMAGILLWAITWMGGGYFFGDIIRRNEMALQIAGHYAAIVFVVVVAGFVLNRWVQQQRFLRYVREHRMDVHELKQLMDDGAEPFVVDLRHPKDYEPDARVLPGAVRIGPLDLESHRGVLPLDRDVILYCSCPNEETSAKVALQLRKMGITRVRPLKGGFDGWKEAGYPLELYLPALKGAEVAAISR